MFSFVILATAILALWATGGARRQDAARHVWLIPFAFWMPVALIERVLEPLALAWIALFAAGCVVATPDGTGRRTSGAIGLLRSRQVRALATISVLVLAGLLMSHLLPGFNNPRVLSRIVLSEGAIPFTLHLNADKPLVGLFLLGWCHARIHRGREWRTMVVRAVPGAAVTVGLLLVLSLLAGYVRPDLKLPASTPLWLGVNLLFTCVAEEALFRGFVQRRLQEAWRPRRGGAAVACGVAAVLFGLAHLGGGWTYVGLATVAGIGYGWVYARTGRIEASILTHFALNTVHFVGFTYPALAR